MRLRWGIASAGFISNDFVLALRTLPNAEHHVAAVGARSKETAQAFAKKLDIPVAYGSYEALCKDKNIDIIYVGSIHPAHIGIVRTALNNGKHVLSEKPLGVNYLETEEMVKLAKEKNLFLMEGVWTRCMPSYAAVRKAIEDNRIGEVIRMTVTFGFKANDESRLVQRNLGGSTALDLGVYCAQLATMVFKGDPEQIIGTGVAHPKEETDMATSTILVYPGGKFATLQTDIRAALPCEAYIIGTEGMIKICRPFHAPNTIIVNGKETEFKAQQDGFWFGKETPDRNRKGWVFENSYFFRHEATRVRECLMRGMKEMPEHPLSDTLKIARILAQMQTNAGARKH